MDSFEPLDVQNFVAFVDTNVILDFLSCHDNVDAVENGTQGADDAYRLRRAGEALRLAIYLHEQGVATYSLPDEALNVARRKVDPTAPGLTGTFMRCVLYFVREQLLSGWGMLILQPEGLTQPNGNDADDYLLRGARLHSKPLISNEGFTSRGIDRANRMQKKAAATGVQLLTPGAFIHRKGSEEEVVRFLSRFLELAPSHRANCGDFFEGPKGAAEDPCLLRGDSCAYSRGALKPLRFRGALQLCVRGLRASHPSLTTVELVAFTSLAGREKSWAGWLGRAARREASLLC